MARKLRRPIANCDFKTNGDVIVEPRDKHTMSLSACLNRIMLNIKEHWYTDSTYEQMKEDFDYVGAKMNLCPEEVAILSCVLEVSSGRSCCRDENIAAFMGMTNIEFIGYRKFLKSLAEKRVVRKQERGMVGNGIAYIVLKEASRAIAEDADFSGRSFVGLSTDMIFSQMRKLFRAVREEELNVEMLLDDIHLMVNANQQNIFCQKVLDCGVTTLPETDQRIFFYLCHRYVSHGDEEVPFMQTEQFMDEFDDEQLLFRQFQAGKLLGQMKGFLTFGAGNGLVDKSNIALSDNVTGEFFTEVDLFSKDRADGHPDVKKCGDIVAKELFYNKPEKEQVGRLESLLEDGHFNGVQARLEEMGMRKGFNIILYGGPGTGKTETVMQLARKTGRDIFCIDMSKTKSMWVGESEKSVKALFRIYRNMCKNKVLKPILFFNEADAVFGKRIENVSSSVDQMHNTMQNIILQEMETLEGILICATNLHGNLDPAFERRFLYKVVLEKPGEDVRSKIWKSMMSDLSESDCSVLAGKYSFSGGQIENVVRKSAVEYILSGEKPTLDKICKFCDQENFMSKSRKVGF